MKKNIIIIILIIACVLCISIIYALYSRLLYSQSFNELALYSLAVCNILVIILGCWFVKTYYTVPLQWKPMAIGACLVLLAFVGTYPALASYMIERSVVMANLLESIGTINDEHELLTRFACSRPFSADSKLDNYNKPLWVQPDWEEFAPKLKKQCSELNLTDNSDY